MKKFILKTILFITLIVLVDFIVGRCFDYISINAKSGGNKKNNYIAYNMNEELLIMGSSRAAHHYKPDVLRDSLSLTCYNCGRDGNGIILMYGRYKMLQERYTPKVIIYDICTAFDVEKNDNVKYLGDLKRFFNISDINSIFDKVSLTESLKMYSRMYRNNSTIINTTGNYIVNDNDTNNGYLPMYKKMEIIPQKKQASIDKKEIDEIKLYYFEKLIQECQGKTKLLFTVSPYFFEQKDTSIYEPIKQLCRKYDIPFIEYDSTVFNENKNLFSDSSHLNDEGATLYSQIIANLVKEYLQW